MNNQRYEKLKQKTIKLCENENINILDLVKYIIFSDTDMNVINEQYGDIESINKMLEEEYNDLWDIQPSIEDDEIGAFAIQHARDLYDVLLDR